VALNGKPAKAANPHVPRTPSEITADALACIAAGMSVVHNHNDEPTCIADGGALPVRTSRPDGTALPWPVAVLGGDVVGCGLARAAIENGDHVRVVLEDYAGVALQPTPSLSRSSLA
jgi:uncharacterized protein (DUF849 family)